MATLQIKKVDHKPDALNIGLVEKLGASLQGRLLRSGDEGYDDARSVWNAMIDRRPALIVQCAGPDDVRTAVNFAAEHHLLTAVRGAGHNIAGNAVCDDGLMIDLSQMRTVRIDAQARRAQVGPGATLGEFDREAQKFGLATPVGINSTTGIGGLTLGGGFGWLSRRLGTTVDNLTAADIVTADGRMLHVSDTENSDLFWAIRGGGGNFGVATKFEFKLHPVGPQLLSGLLVFSFDEAESVLQAYRDFASRLPDETSVWAVVRQAPPLPFLPENVHGTKIVALAVCHSGKPAEGEKIIAPIRGFGTLLGEHIGVQPFTAWQSAFDPLLTPGARNYWKSHNFLNLNDETIDIVIRSVENLPSPQCEMFIGLLGGAVNRVAADATAYPHRTTNFIINVHSRWEHARDDDKCIAWAREFYLQSAPYATGGVYVNFMTADETERVRAAYGACYDRLAEIKRKYDPENLFRLNQNIRS